MSQLNNEQTIIMKLLSTYGCVSLPQLYDLFPNVKRKFLQIFISQLIKDKYIEIFHDKYLVNYTESSRYSQQNIDMLWAIMRLTHNNLTEILDTIKAAKPCDYMLTVNNKTTFRLMTATISNLAALKSMRSDKPSTKKKFPSESYYAIVCPSKDMLQVLREYDFDVPVYILYLQYDGLSRPVVKKLCKKPTAE